MTELEKVLRAHFSKYSQMLPQDTVKLIYQGEFGPGHMIDEPGACLSRLEEEYATVGGEGQDDLLQDIGFGLCRIDLRAVKDGAFIPAINRVFIDAGREITGNMEIFLKKLDVLHRLAEMGETPFSQDQLNEYLDPYIKSGCPAVSHSETYKAAYRPAYRVIFKRLAFYLPLFAAIEALLRKKSGFSLAIDGFCGAGKSTLADHISRLYGCPVIHMDDFFLPPRLRTPERMAEPGGNVHYERFLSEVIPGLKSGREFSYRAFDCSVMDYAPARKKASPFPFVVVEGSYSLHPSLFDRYDLRVFLDCPPETQLERLRKREKPAMLRRFISEWIPMENLYFRTFNIKERCDLLFFT